MSFFLVKFLLIVLVFFWFVSFDVVLVVFVLVLIYKIFGILVLEAIGNDVSCYKVIIYFIVFGIGIWDVVLDFDGLVWFNG